MNKNGICDTNGILFSYMVPGLISGVLSAIFQAKGFNQYTGNFAGNFDRSQRTTYGQGAIQVAGFGIAIGCGIFAGVVSALLMKFTNQR